MFFLSAMMASSFDQALILSARSGDVQPSFPAAPAGTTEALPRPYQANAMDHRHQADTHPADMRRRSLASPPVPMHVMHTIHRIHRNSKKIGTRTTH
jgi:hypothetical protein